ncbi:MAG TPA: polysaccharide deacetylase family protein, partial [Actinopolymorphaceae bacterium]|nr:polysaccharide deacetylase family protein [Actinopolymorphaceae bacterium]
YSAQVRAAGHTIGNHTYDHKDLTGMSSDEAKKEMQTGPQSRCMRPPYGATNDQVHATASDLNLRVVLWDVDPRDWATPGTDTIVSRVMAGISDGAIILMHDGGGDRSESVAALDELLTKLSAKGYTFQSLDC